MPIGECATRPGVNRSSVDGVLQVCGEPAGGVEARRDDGHERRGRRRERHAAGQVRPGGGAVHPAPSRRAVRRRGRHRLPRRLRAGGVGLPRLPRQEALSHRSAAFLFTQLCLFDTLTTRIQQKRVKQTTCVDSEQVHLTQN